MKITIAAGGRPRPGETACGDAWGVISDGGRHLVILADGLGHGPEAAAAAQAVVGFISATPWQPLDQLLRGCHAAVTHTRGAAVALLMVDAGTREGAFAGVGNVEVVAACQDHARPISAPGVVGGRLRKVQETRFRICEGDLFILHTDGVSSRFSPDDWRGMDPALAMRRLLATHAKDHDDAACVFVCC